MSRRPASLLGADDEAAPDGLKPAFAYSGEPRIGSPDLASNTPWASWASPISHPAQDDTIVAVLIPGTGNVGQVARVDSEGALSRAGPPPRGRRGIPQSRSPGRVCVRLTTRGRPLAGSKREHHLLSILARDVVERSRAEAVPESALRADKGGRWPHEVEAGQPPARVGSERHMAVPLIAHRCDLEGGRDRAIGPHDHLAGAERSDVLNSRRRHRSSRCPSPPGWESDRDRAHAERRDLAASVLRSVSVWSPGAYRSPPCWPPASSGVLMDPVRRALRPLDRRPAPLPPPIATRSNEPQVPDRSPFQPSTPDVTKQREPCRWRCHGTADPTGSGNLWTRK